MNMLVWKWKVLQKRIYVLLFSKKVNLIGDEKYTKQMYRIIFGRKLDVEHPKTYNEHLSVNKLKLDASLYAPFADKYAVREYVEKTIGRQYLNEVLGVYHSFDEINFDQLPDAFALKCTHGSSFNLIVPDKEKLDKRKAKVKFDKWMKTNYYYPMREKQYRDIVPRIMCDAYLATEDNSPLNEVKLYCIGGKVRFIMDNYEKDGIRYSNVYDRSWNRLNVTYGFPGNDKIEKPATSSELVVIAEKLAGEFPFVRVDLYNVEGKILFSELTFCPAGGMTPMNPDTFDYEMGKYFEEGQV